MVDILRDTQIPLPATYSPQAIEGAVRDLVVSIEQLKFDGKTGHRHTGVAGDGALIAAGAVLQVQYTTDIVQRTLASATMAEVATQFRRSFTPISASSLLRLRATFTMNPSAQTQIIQFKFRDITNNVDVGTGTAVGSRTAVSTADRASSYDTNSPAIVVLDCIVSATNTTARIYSIYGKGEDGSTIYINQSALNSTTGWNAPFFFTIEEISTALTNPPSTKWTDLTGSQSAILVSGFNNDAGYLIDAPVDGTTYGRKNGSWSAASGSPMVYPGSGIPVSTGTAWGTSITPPSDATKYLDGTGNWSVPSGGGASTPAFAFNSDTARYARMAENANSTNKWKGMSVLSDMQMILTTQIFN